MKKLIEYYNKYYGDKFINLEYPKTKKDIYRAYSYIKDFYESNPSIYEYDTELQQLLNFTELPKPKGINETVLYYQCKDYIGNDEVVIDFTDIKKENVVSIEGEERIIFSIKKDIDNKFFSPFVNIISRNLMDYNFDNFYKEGDDIYSGLKPSIDSKPSYREFFLTYPNRQRVIISNNFNETLIEIAMPLSDVELALNTLKDLKIKLYIPRYPVNTKVHILEETDTFDNILPLVCDGYLFVKRVKCKFNEEEINDFLQRDIPIPFYEYVQNTSSIIIYLEEESILFRHLGKVVDKEGCYEIS